MSKYFVCPINSEWQPSIQHMMGRHLRSVDSVTYISGDNSSLSQHKPDKCQEPITLCYSIWAEVPVEVRLVANY